MSRMRTVGRLGVVGALAAVAVTGCADEADPAPDEPAVIAAGVSGRFIVAFRDDAAGRAALSSAGGTIARELGPQNAVAVQLPSAAVAGLQHHPAIDYIEEDEIREPTALSDTVLPSGEVLPYGVQMVQGNLVLPSNPGNRKICIIDSGYSQQHDDLRDETTGMVTGGLNAGSGHWDQDSCGHGSHVAGTISAIGGNGTGVASVNPGVRLHIVKVFGDDNLPAGNCGWSYSSDLVAAVNECRAAGANVINMSLGGSRKTRTEENVFKAAYAEGLLPIAAAGNGGTTQTSYPAGYATVMSVAAVDANEMLGSFSQRNRDVEIAAPGVAVLSTVPWAGQHSLSAGGATGSGLHIEGTALTTGTSGDLVDGGLCDAVGAWAGKVVVCKRGSITFAEKVQNVKAGGGVAAVLYNSATSDASCGDFGATMGDGVTSTIPGITLSCAEGEAALANVGTVGTVTSMISFPGTGYEAWDGTSMATPHVAAVAALIWSCNPSATNTQIRNALTGTARDLGAAGRDNSYGFGLVQAKAALLSLGVGTCTVQ